MKKKRINSSSSLFKSIWRFCAVTGLVVILGMVIFTIKDYVNEDLIEPVFQVDGKSLNANVLSYQPLVREQLAEYNLENYTGIVLALMMQESGGRGTDPMQASESYCGERGCIDDPELSIKKGVEYFAYVLDQSEGDVKLALQSYNFGPGFIEYALENGGEYTQEAAIDYSAMMYKQLSDEIDFRCIRQESEQYDACYGDIRYVDAVLSYYPDAKEHMGEVEDPVVVAEGN